MSERYVPADTDQRPIAISRSDARNFPAYERARKQARAEGRELHIVSDVEYSQLKGIEPAQPSVPDSLITDSRGRQFVPITKRQAADFRTYQKMRNAAIEMGVQWEVVDDDYFSTDGPEAA